MALQQIYWEQIATEDITSGQTVNLGNPTASLDNVYAKNLYLNGEDIGTVINSNVDALNRFTASVSESLEFTGSNLTVKGDLAVLGTFTSIRSEKVTLDDNVIELNGSEQSFGGLMIKDPTAPNTVSGSLLWDTTTDRWIGGPLGGEENFVLESELLTLSSSLSSSITDLSSSVSNSLDQLQKDIEATNIFQQTGSYYSTVENLQISGSGLDSPDGEISGKYSVIVSHSLHAENINVGVPTSNDWQSNLEGSYFNNFNHNTDVSEMLRFIAGLLSSSAPDASPNTKTYSNYTRNNVNTTTGTVTPGVVPQNSTNETILYLVGQGFASEGSTIFNGISPIYTNSGYGHTYTSVAGGSTIVSSSNDSQLFGLGLLSSGTPTTFKVSGSFDFKFMDNSSKTLTESSSSNHLITQTGEGTTDGVTLAKIYTVNPAVIPPAYQDGKYVSVFSPTIYNGGATAVSSSGYYEITGSLSVASGSSDFTTPITTETQIFYAPLSVISSNVPSQTPTFSDVTTNALTAESRSLSGAPYLTTATYNISGSIEGLFDPLYHNSTIATITDNSSLVNESGLTTVSISSGLINTSNAVYDVTGTTPRSIGTIPYENDIVKVNAVSTFNASTNENINQIGLGTTTFNLLINGYNKNGSVTTNTSTLNFHTAGDFGQPIDSGSLAYYGRTQGTDTATTLSEPFLGENYRLQLNDNILSFGGDSWDTTFGLYNLGNQDLQVKPGYLVKPGGTYGYWLTNPSTSSDYKYYIRKFSTSGTKTSMTINLGKTLSSWSSNTDNSVSAVVLFESSNNTVYPNARVYDPTETLSNSIGTINSNTDGTNPFGSDIDLYGNTGGLVSSTTYTMPIRNADGMFINSTYNEVYLIVRYKGDPSPITGITISFS